jgi:hypothetical protein
MYKMSYLMEMSTQDLLQELSNHLVYTDTIAKILKEREER